MTFDDLPERISETMRLVVDGKVPDITEAVAYLADELTAFVGDHSNGAEYVPRSHLFVLLDYVRQQFFGRDLRIKPISEATILGLSNMLDEVRPTMMPAYYLHLDWEKMTDEQKQQAWGDCWRIVQLRSDELPAGHSGPFAPDGFIIANVWPADRSGDDRPDTAAAAARAVERITRDADGGPGPAAGGGDGDPDQPDAPGDGPSLPEPEAAVRRPAEGGAQGLAGEGGGAFGQR